jgi:quercetin dioxygenase-like cupin family protein
VRRAGALLVWGLIVAAAPLADQPETRSGTVLDNPTVLVMRQHLLPGERRTVRAVTTPLLVVEPGHDPLYLAKGGERVIDNEGGEPADVLIVAVKPTRPPAPAAPPTEAPAGITRTTLMDEAEVRVVRVRFAPGSREPVHTHPNDLLTIQLTPGGYDVVLGSTVAGGQHDAGFAQFLPRDVPHAYVSTDSRSFELLSISIK